MSLKLSDFFQPKLVYSFLKACVLIGMIGFLVATGHIPVREVALEVYGVKALLSGATQEKWKPILSRIVLEADTPWATEVGLFLQINNEQNIDGRLARNYGEICYAVRKALKPSPNQDVTCTPEDFARTRMAVETLKHWGFLEPHKYVAADYWSYRLNALGTNAFEAVRVKWLQEGNEKARIIALLDSEYPGLRRKLLEARDWYGAQIKAELKRGNDYNS
ncbi:hypothetical protein V5T82_16740 [Magnetovibrio sp. PR-2]|uniref:hypothetical protein n=1 Tax=Magnetovibrio sp. PR-2 TaxID=3120356 RepID=UPI002FCDE424